LHLVSKDTLIRRYDKIEIPPEFLILDEAHLYYDQQANIQEHYPDARIVGVSASPERLDGRGLSDLYDVLVDGPDIRWLTERGYLVPPRYFAPPFDGLETLHRRGYEYDEADLAELLERRQVYGSAIEHYEKHAAGKTALVFARSVAAAEDVAGRFAARGWRFEPVSGRTPPKQRATLIAALKAGELHGAVTCEIATYGLDVPRVECLIMLRPTLSRALYTQMIGRGLRPYRDKTECVILDHVGLLAEHGHPLAPYTWQFDGREKRARGATDPDFRLHLCPETFLWCERPSCVGCEHNTTGRKTRAEHVVDCQLVEEPPPVALEARPLEERQIYQDRLGAALEAARAALDAGDIAAAHGPIDEALALGRQIGRNPMWLYHRLSMGRVSVNVPLLHEIARCEGYKPGWVWFKKKQIRARLAKEKANGRIT
jgi:superfamily II DNA or RNA helicase